MNRSDNRFEVQRDEGVKEVVGEHGYQPERFNGAWSVFIHMIGVPKGRQFIECLVFDIPSRMCGKHKGLGRGDLFKDCADPHPS